MRHVMAPIYAKLIKENLRTIDQVPDSGTLRNDVQEILDEEPTDEA